MRVSGAGERCIKLKTNIMQADDYTIIDRYLQGELSAEEQADFELRLQSDAALAAQLNFRQQANTYLRTQQKLPDLEKKMASLSKDYFATADKAKIRRLARRRPRSLLALRWQRLAHHDQQRRLVESPDGLLRCHE